MASRVWDRDQRALGERARRLRTQELRALVESSGSMLAEQTQAPYSRRGPKENPQLIGAPPETPNLGMFLLILTVLNKDYNREYIL